MSLLKKFKEIESNIASGKGVSSLTKKENIIEDGTEVLIVPGIIGTIQGNDSEDCEVDNNGNLIDLNYYIVPLGKTFDKEIMTIEPEIIVLGQKRICPNCGAEIKENQEVKIDENRCYANCPLCHKSVDLEKYYE